MMKEKVIHTSLRADFHTLNYKGNPVMSYDEKLHGFLETFKGFPYPNFLAGVRYKTKTVDWLSSEFTYPPSPLSNIHETAEREKYILLLKAYIEAYEELIKKNEASENGWSELLSQALCEINEEDVYCGDNKIVLINWGLLPKEKQQTSGIYKKGLFMLPMPDLSRSAGKESSSSGQSESDNSTDPDKTNKQTESATEEKNLNAPAYTPDKKEEKEQSPENKNKTTKNKQQENNPPYTDSDKPVSSNLSKSPQKSKKKTSTEQPTPTPPLPPPPPPLKREKKWPKLLGWVLLILLLLFLLSLLLRGCKNNSILPPAERNTIFPIDSITIGYDQDSVFSIVTDRLNIILEKEEETTFHQFAKEFKRLYPGNEYVIKYYDLKTYRLQIQIPSSERENIKESLPLQMPGFDFCIFDESILDSELLPNDPGFDNHNQSWYFNAVQAYGAWDITLGEPDVIVAIVDNGFDLNHPEIASKIIKPYNVISGNSTVRPVFSRDYASHGTHVAATAVGECNNQTGVAGIAPNCKLMPVQIATPANLMTTTTLIDGILYAIYEGADVINASIGKSSGRLGMFPPSMQLSYIQNNGLEEERVWRKVHEIAEKHNCVIVWSAGNDNVISGIDPSKRYPSGIKVSAVNKNLAKADFSNYGNFSDYPTCYSTLSAPGVGIYNAAPDNSYESLQGTSMAAPIVTGGVALLKSVDRSLNTQQIIEIFQLTGITCQEPIGNIIQLENALLVASGREKLPPPSSPSAPPIDCDSLQKRARELLFELERIRQLCPELSNPTDTLSIPKIINNPEQLNGLWKSTTPLFNSISREPLELYMEFYHESGKLIIVHEDNTQYTAPLSIQISAGNLFITQLSEAVNEWGDAYRSYLFNCRANKRGIAECEAHPIDNEREKVKFNLIKIQ